MPNVRKRQGGGERGDAVGAEGGGEALEALGVVACDKEASGGARVEQPLRHARKGGVPVTRATACEQCTPPRLGVPVQAREVASEEYRGGWRMLYCAKLGRDSAAVRELLQRELLQLAV